MKHPLILPLILAPCLAGLASRSDAVSLQEERPSRYVVQAGDTLWGISSRYLDEPWRWPEIRPVDPLSGDFLPIREGDVLILAQNDGAPALRVLPRAELVLRKLEPRVRAKPRPRVVATIPFEAVRPFLIQPLIVDEAELRRSGYVVGGVEDNIVLGTPDRFYARGLQAPMRDLYQVYRPGKNLLHPVTGAYLGTEAIYLGEARMVQEGEVAKLEILNSVDEITPGDRLLEAGRKPVEPYYHPRPPAAHVSGHVLHAPGGVSEVGRHHVVAVSLGAVDGMEQGHVLRIKHRKPPYPDPVTGGVVRLPEESSGLLMLFRVFERVSYGLVMSASRAIHVNDSVTSPSR